MRHFALLSAAALLALSSLPAAAQSPSADSIIRSLRPTGPSGTTRGICPVGPSAEPSAPAAGGGAGMTPRAAAGAGAAAAGAGGAGAAAATTARAPSVNLTVQFASGSAELTPEARRTLDQLGRALSSSELSGFRFRIEGHTDTVGTPETNKALSEARAAKVLDYLATQYRIDRSKIETVGMGEEQLLVPTGPNVSQPRNRRVTVVNLGA